MCLDVLTLSSFRALPENGLLGPTLQSDHVLPKARITSIFVCSNLWNDPTWTDSLVIWSNSIDSVRLHLGKQSTSLSGTRKIIALSSVSGSN